MLIFRCFVSNPTLNPVTFGFGGRKPNPQTSRQNQTFESHDPRYVAKNRKPALGSQETKWRYEAIYIYYVLYINCCWPKKNLQHPGSPHHLSLTGFLFTRIPGHLDVLPRTIPCCWGRSSPLPHIPHICRSNPGTKLLPSGTKYNSDSFTGASRRHVLKQMRENTMNQTPTCKITIWNASLSVLFKKKGANSENCTNFMLVSLDRNIICSLRTNPGIQHQKALWIIVAPKKKLDELCKPYRINVWYYLPTFGWVLISCLESITGSSSLLLLKCLKYQEIDVRLTWI